MGRIAYIVGAIALAVFIARSVVELIQLTGVARDQEREYERLIWQDSIKGRPQGLWYQAIKVRAARDATKALARQHQALYGRS